MASNTAIVSAVLGALLLSACLVVIMSSAEVSEGSSPASLTTERTELAGTGECPDMMPGAIELGKGFDIFSYTAKDYPIAECTAAEPKAKYSYNGAQYSTPKWVNYNDDNSRVTEDGNANVMSSRYSFADSFGIGVSAGVKVLKGVGGGNVKVNSGNSASGNTAGSKVTVSYSKALSEYTLMARTDKREFEQAITHGFQSMLSAAKSSGNYNSLFERYGTHMVAKVTVGGSATSSAKVRASNDARKQSSSFKLGLSANIGPVKGGVNIHNSKKSSYSHEYGNVDFKLSCVGGDNSRCGTSGWAQTVKEHPAVIHTPTAPEHVIPLDEAVPDCINGVCGHKAALKKSIATYIGTMKSKCPGFKPNPGFSSNPGVGGEICTDSSRGLCNPVARTCACQGPRSGNQPGYAGAACESYQVGMGTDCSKNTCDYRGGVFFNGEQGRNVKQASVCDGNTGPRDWVGKTYSNNHGPIAGFKIGAYCPAQPMIKLPAGVCIQVYALWGNWGPYDNPNGWPSNLQCRGGCQDRGTYCGGTTGKEVHIQDRFCAYKMWIQDGYKC